MVQRSIPGRKSGSTGSPAAKIFNRGGFWWHSVAFGGLAVPLPGEFLEMGKEKVKKR